MIVKSFELNLPVDLISSIIGMPQDEIIAILRKHGFMSCFS
jgi:hypothetical protein